MPFTLRCVQHNGDKCFTKLAIHAWCKKLAPCRESAVDVVLEGPGTRFTKNLTTFLGKVTT